jgi:hypothetical protein
MLKNKKEEKAKIKEDKNKARMEKFGIDWDSYDMNELRSRNSESAQEIAASLSGSRLFTAGALLSSKPEIAFAMEQGRAQIEQNFIIMRQNEEIIRWLKAIYAQGQTQE